MLVSIASFNIKRTPSLATVARDVSPGFERALRFGYHEINKKQQYCANFNYDLL